MPELNANTEHRWSLIYRLRDDVTVGALRDEMYAVLLKAEGMAAALATEDAQAKNDELRMNAAWALADKLCELRALADAVTDMESKDRHA